MFTMTSARRNLSMYFSINLSYSVAFYISIFTDHIYNLCQVPELQPFEEEETKTRFTNYSMSSSVIRNTETNKSCTSHLPLYINISCVVTWFIQRDRSLFLSFLDLPFFFKDRKNVYNIFLCSRHLFLLAFACLREQSHRCFLVVMP